MEVYWPPFLLHFIYVRAVIPIAGSGSKEEEKTNSEAADQKTDEGDVTDDEEGEESWEESEEELEDAMNGTDTESVRSNSAKTKKMVCRLLFVHVVDFFLVFV